MLDRVAAPAADLLGRVDVVLASAGAPADHPLWPLLRRLRALPGDAVGAIAATTSAPLAAAGSVLRATPDGYVRRGASLPDSGHWHGAAADSFAAQWTALRAHLVGDLADRAAATVSYVDALAGWLDDLRAALARTLAVVLGSAEAARVRTASVLSPEVSLAAADIAVRVLETLAVASDRGEEIMAEWAPRLAEGVYRAPTGSPPDLDSTTRVQLS